MRAAALVLVLLSATAFAADDVPKCKQLTGKDGCSECRKNVCLYCNSNMGMTWKGTGATLQIESCLAPRASCPAAINDANCRLCVGSTTAPTCIACKTPAVSVTGAGKTWSIPNNVRMLSWAAGANFGKCVTGTKAKIAGNNACQQWNPDGTCTLCTGHMNPVATRKYVMPNNAQFTNGIHPMSMCKTKAQLAEISRAAFITDKTTAAAGFPAECAEVDTALRCQRCQPGFSINSKGTKCVANVKNAAKGSNGCILTLPFQAYCEKCNGAGNACTTCVPGRSMAPAGICNLPCKALYGLTCAACNANKCTKNDSNFPNGRR